jgi:hypothetical protein
MVTPKQLRKMSQILTPRGKDVRENAKRAPERSRRLRERADRAKLSAHAKYAHAKAARNCQDER